MERYQQLLQNELSERISRRKFGIKQAKELAVVMALTACNNSPSLSQSERTHGESEEVWQTRWEQTIEGAKKEGALVVSDISNQGSPKGAYEGFEKAFPGVVVERRNFPSASLLLPVLLKEQQAGIFPFDVVILAGSRQLPELRDNNALDPLKPVIYHPEVLNDNTWRGGFEAGFIDVEKGWGFAQTEDIAGQTWINTDLVKEGELKSVDDLLNPKWKGKMIFPPYNNGFTNSPATSLRLKYGEDYLSKLFVEQQPTFQPNTRLLTEEMVRGKYAIAFAVTPEFLVDYQAEGLGKNIKPIDLLDLEYTVLGSILVMMRNAPHPNVTRLFVNWLLTQGGQSAFVETTGLNSRRLDVPSGNPNRAPDPKKGELMQVGREEFIPELNKTEDLLRKLLVR